MTDKKKLTLAPPLASFERMKRALFVGGLMVLMELSDPRPFQTTWMAKLLVFLLVSEIIRQFIQYRVEISMGAVVRRQTMRRSWDRFRNKIASDTRYKMRRFAILIIGLLTYGFILDAITDSCSGAVSCVVRTPQMAVEALPMAIQIAFYISISLFQFGILIFSMTKVGFVKIIPPGTIVETFDDVWGQDDARDKVMEQVALLEEDSKITAAGGYMPKGVLLWGPPGTGKTLLAKAAANASTKPLVMVPPGAFVSTFMGINYMKVYMLFKIIRKWSLRSDGVIVFFDEIDSLGHRGGEVVGDPTAPLGSPPPCAALPLSVSSEELWAPVPPPVLPDVPEKGHLSMALHAVDRWVVHNIINIGGQDQGTLTAFLAGFDGMQEPRGLMNKILGLFGFKPMPPPVYRYFMLGATNRPGAIDPALMRAGRLGRKIMVDYPKYEGRIKTYDGYLAKVAHTLSEDDIEWMARNHYRGTGAEIKDIVNEAVLLTFAGDREGGGIDKQDLTNAMLYKRYGESTGVNELARNVWGVAVHEAGHAVAFHYLLRERANIWFASIEGRGETGGMVVPSPTDDDWHMTSREMRAEMQVALASRAAEVQLLGEASNGHGGDGPAATDGAIKYVKMGHHRTVGFLVSLDLELMVELMEEVLTDAEYDVAKLLEEKDNHLHLIAKLLERDHTVPGDKIHKMLDWLDERYDV